MSYFAQRSPKICQYARVSVLQLLGWYIMPALGYPHRHTLFGDFRARDPDKTNNHGVPGRRRVFEKNHLVAGRIGENRLKNEALPLLNEFASQRICHLCGYVRADFQFACQDVSIYEAQTRRPKMSVIKS